MAAGLGLDATGVDLAVTALHTAERKAQERGLEARFLHQDARRLADLGESFDTVLDCGLFHVFTGDDRDAFAGSLRSAVRPGGRYFMLGFSDRQPDGPGPHRLTREDITGTFAAGWRADSVEPATIEVTTSPAGVPGVAGRLHPDLRRRCRTATARIETDRPSRYLIQLCEHANAMAGAQDRTHAGRAHHEVRVRAEWTGDHGVIHFEPWGRCTLEATATTLLLRAEATGEDGPAAAPGHHRRRRRQIRPPRPPDREAGTAPRTPGTDAAN